jgi:hypothetical protein
MLIPNHPHDERLSALASGEADATGDAALTAHVGSCTRCTGLIDELGALRAALADLPDVAPSRPLRLLPPVEAAPASAADRLGGWARRFFAPVLASGAALALVGVIGTAGPSFSGQAASPGSGEDDFGTVAQEEAAASEPAATAPPDAAAGGAPAAAESMRSLAEPLADSGELLAVTASPLAAYEAPDQSSDERDAASPPTTIGAERSPWPMVLFAGVALMIGALVLRWILVPRAG